MSRDIHVAQSSASVHTVVDIGESPKADGHYRPWMVVRKRTYERKGTTPSVSTKGVDKWTAKPSCDMGISNPDPSRHYLRNDKSLDNSLGLGSGVSPSPSSQALKKLASSVKGKKVIARGSPAKANTFSADNPLSKILAAKIASLSSDRGSSPNREKGGSSNPVFEFTAPSIVGQELHGKEDKAHLADDSEGTLGKPLVTSFEFESLTNIENGKESARVPEMWTLLVWSLEVGVDGPSSG
ncbi:hypothetical protein SO802_034237 [Lithocarpus litseifolius]|uniref:Uncharacterized protein n=1 Tax=Lithocarpus litseifolius TaxID=425828 RepID=A0AAW2BI08_9ROSI